MLEMLGSARSNLIGAGAESVSENYSSGSVACYCSAVAEGITRYEGRLPPMRPRRAPS